MISLDILQLAGRRKRSPYSPALFLSHPYFYTTSILAKPGASAELWLGLQGCAFCPRRLSSLSCSCSSHSSHLAHLSYTVDCNYVPQTVFFPTGRRNLLPKAEGTFSTSNITACTMQEEHHCFKIYSVMKPSPLPSLSTPSH